MSKGTRNLKKAPVAAGFPTAFQGQKLMVWFRQYSMAGEMAVGADHQNCIGLCNTEQFITSGKN